MSEPSTQRKQPQAPSNQTRSNQTRSNQTRSIQTQWIVAVIKDPRAVGALRELDGQCELLPSAEAILTGEFRQQPSLFVVEADRGAMAKTVDLIRALRHRQPLTDIIIWAPRASGTAVRAAFRAGAKDVVASQSTPQLLAEIRASLEQQQLLPRVNQLSQQRGRTARFESMLTRNQTMWDLFDLCVRIAPTEATVLIIGETGTGKELLARAVHRQSKRRGRFVAANCASIPPDLVNSELFGHEKGAFTGADRAKAGLVTHADNGTLFLDEIGDMPAEAQQSLLRMLQEKRVRPVGSLQEQQVDVRVVAATNVPLDEAVRAGDFREDLFYRLDVIRMNIPPLRDRPEDILFLFGHFTKKLAKHYGLSAPVFADSFVDALLAYEWPGNIRQLENISERLVLARTQRALTARDFAKLRTTSLTGSGDARSHASDKPQPVTGGIVEGAPVVDTSRSLQANIATLVERHECAYLSAILAENDGRIGVSADKAGISRRTLLRKMKQYSLDKSEFRP